VVDFLAINCGSLRMLDWLKRKAVPAPSEQLLESEDQKPLTDERLERLLGRLGPDSKPRSEPVVDAVKLAPQPRTGDATASEPVAEALRVDPPAAEAPAAEAARGVERPPIADSSYTLRREDRGQGPSAAELLAKGYSFATGPDGKMVVFDAEGRVTDTAVPRPSAGVREQAARAFKAPEPLLDAEGNPLPEADQSAAEAPVAPALEEPEPPAQTDDGKPETPAAEALQQPEPEPQNGRAEPEPPAVEALQQPVPEPQTGRKRAKKPATEAPQEPAPQPQTERRSARTPAPAAANEIEPPRGTDRKAPTERVGGSAGMYVIAVASQKGGSGKTTIAAHLAVRAAAAGNGPVVLIDTDPQGSLAEWWHARADDTPALASVKPEALAANLAELRSYGTAIAVIDTPPALTGSIEQVIATADLIVIPARPSPHDLRAASGTVEMARKAGKPFIFVVNGASPRASITAQAVAALSEHGRVAPVILYQRTEYAASMIDGRTVTETAPSGRSAQEIIELWQAVYAQIGLRVAA